MNTNMYLTLALVISVAAVAVNASLQDVCNQALASQNDPSFISFCVTSLQVDPKSQTADTKGLALISCTLAKANLTHNEEKVKELLNSKSVPEKSGLEDCKELYEDSIDDVGEAIDALNKNDKGTAQTMLSTLLTNIGTCMDSLKEANTPPVLDKENSDADRICTVALAITNLI